MRLQFATMSLYNWQIEDYLLECFSRQAEHPKQNGQLTYAENISMTHSYAIATVALLF